MVRFYFLKIPVELTDGGGNTTTIGLEQLVYEAEGYSEVWQQQVLENFAKKITAVPVLIE